MHVSEPLSDLAPRRSYEGMVIPLQIATQVLCSRQNLSTTIHVGNNGAGLLKDFLRMGLKVLKYFLLRYWFE